MRSRRVVILALALAAGTTGCKKKPKPLTTPPVVSAPRSFASVAPPESKAAETKPTMPPAGGPGWAYLKSKELVGIDPSGKLTVIKSKKGFVGELLRASDGNAYALVHDSPSMQIALLSAGTLRVVASLPKCYSLDGLFDARGDHFVIKCSEGIFEKESASAPWVTVAPPGGTDYDRKLWLSKTGSLWYVSNNGAYERKGGDWAKAEAKSTYMASPKAFFDGPDGVYFARGGSLYRTANGKLEELRELKGYQPLTPASNALFAFWNSDTRAVSFQTLSGEAKRIEKTKAWLSRGALDDSGRAWSILDGQIEIANPDGSEATRIPMGSYAELDHVSEHAGIVLLGAGPAIPAPKPVRKAKKVTGRLVLNGKPLAETEIEICPRSDWTFGGSTPCGGADESVVFKGTTDAKGGFSFDDVPVGSTYMHYKVPDATKWTVDGTSLEPREGKLTNLGTLAYTK